MVGRLSLPVDDFLPEVKRILSESDSLVVTAAPGAGKTTRLPPALLDVIEGQILVLEPRRMAAIAAATRIAEENGWELGREVGWQVRFEKKTGPQTRLIFLTEALLARRMITDPELTGVGAVILDEFHERSLSTDLTFGLLKELRQLGRDLRLVVMSATLQAEKLSQYLGDAPILKIPGKLFELEVRHRKMPQRLQTDYTFDDQVIEAVREAQAKSDKDILLFLPGVGEIQRLMEKLSSWAGKSNVDLQALHGSLPLEEQRNALKKGPRQRVVLSTNIAESSVTVDGVGVVIDSGLAKVHRFDVRTGFGRLDLSRISLNSAIQRSGRAARQYPGISYRLWNVQDEMSMPKDDIPEVMRSDLSEALLFLAFQGVTDFAAFPWYEMPPTRHLDSARSSLISLGALDSAGRITSRGKEFLRYPVPPRVAALLVAAQELEKKGIRGASSLAAKTAAILQERDFVGRETSKSHFGDRLECDLSLRLHLLDRLRPREILKAADQIGRLLSGSDEDGKSTDDPVLLRKLLLAAFPDRLCRRRGSSERGLMTGGRGVKLAPESLVRESEFFIALSGVDGLEDAETVVGIACGFSKEFLIKEAGDRLQRQRELVVDEKAGRILMREVRAIGDFAIDEPNLTPASAEQIAEKLPELCAKRFNVILEKNENLAQWISRWNFLKRKDPDIVFEFNEAELRAAFSEAAYGEKSVDSVANKELIFFFESRLPAEDLRRLKSELPDKVTVPSGSAIRIQYPNDKDPYIEVRLQEVFGWADSPKLLNGRIPLTIHLLGPNFRPVQVTSDLSSFWKNGYPEVRSELRARYPKHSWPDDPLTAKAEAKGRRRF